MPNAVCMYILCTHNTHTLFINVCDLQQSSKVHAEAFQVAWRDFQQRGEDCINNAFSSARYEDGSNATSSFDSQLHSVERAIAELQACSSADLQDCRLDSEQSSRDRMVQVRQSLWGCNRRFLTSLERFIDSVPYALLVP